MLTLQASRLVRRGLFCEREVRPAGEGAGRGRVYNDD